MIDRIKSRRDGKLAMFLEATEGFAAADLARKKLGPDAPAVLPAEMLEFADAAGDMVVAVRSGSAAARSVAKLLDVRVPKLPAGGYRIRCVSGRGRKVLLIVGGDTFGMLAGMSDALLHSEVGPKALVYRGGEKTEKPAFGLRFYWTWDHSTNWMLDDPGMQYQGCTNPYTKRPETYIEDYRRLVDHCIDMRFNAIIIWGFLRDSHGGERYAYEVAEYAAQRGVAIMPGVGTTGYGGVYYEGNHPCNIETYLAQHPKRGNMSEDGTYAVRQSSPYCPENIEWMDRAMDWLLSEFPIGGVNLENSDLMVDYSAAGKRGRKKLRTGEPDFLKDQYFAYKSALGVCERLCPQAWNTYATYCGFGTGGQAANAGANMGREPYFAKHMPPSAIAMWTLTGMVREQPVPLRSWMDSPAPKGIYENPNWPRGLCPPTPRSAGFLHQASQWHRRFPRLRRGDIAISTFAEGCLRSHQAGLEGIGVHGEVSSCEMPWLVNYLAMRHWTYHPKSTLAEFAAAELAVRLGGEKEAMAFVDCLCDLDEGKIGQRLADKAWRYAGQLYPRNFPPSGDVRRFRIWEQLMELNERIDVSTRRPYEVGYAPANIE